MEQYKYINAFIATITYTILCTLNFNVVSANYKHQLQITHGITSEE